MLGNDLVEHPVVELQVGTGGGLVIEVILHPACLEELFLHSGKYQAVGYFSIFLSPHGEVLVVTVDLQEVLFPECRRLMFFGK